jgi:hypothetical protein
MLENKLHYTFFFYFFPTRYSEVFHVIHYFVSPYIVISPVTSLRN